VFENGSARTKKGPTKGDPNYHKGENMKRPANVTQLLKPSERWHRFDKRPYVQNVSR